MNYYTCCLNSTYELIMDLKKSAKGISYKTFRKYAIDVDIWAKNMKYDKDLSLKNDIRVKYFKGKYNNIPCVFLVYSGIEYIWI